MTTPSPLEQELRQILAIVHDRPSARVNNVLALIARHEAENATYLAGMADQIRTATDRRYMMSIIQQRFAAILPPGAGEGDV